MRNLNAKCFCTHALAQHLKGDGQCGRCNCDHFTEALVESCRYCHGLLSVLTAPNDEVIRLGFSPVPRTEETNYAHVKCHTEFIKGEKGELKGPFSRTPPKPTPPPRPGQITLPRESVEALHTVLYKCGAFEIDGSVAEGDWTDEELTLLATIANAV